MLQSIKIPRSRAIWDGMRIKTNPVTGPDDTFHGFTVCEEWKTQDGFLAWYSLNNVDGYELACDIYNNDNKHYSPETACFVPPTLASLLRNRGHGFPIGIWKHFSGWVGTYWRSSYHTTGKYPDEANAWKAYGLHKLRDYREKISEDLYHHIVNQISSGAR